jgi:polysaccharide biosynthesis protein PslG
MGTAHSVSTKRRFSTHRRLLSKTCSILPLLLALAGRILASDLPPAVIPEGVGVNIHFTRGHERDLDLIAAAGFRFIRMDFSWGGTERKRGEYDWSEYDALTASLEQRQLRPVYILDYSNGLWEESIVSRDPVSGREHRDTASPQKPESVEAFARWAAAAAVHFRGHRVIWEIWNEPNIGFWKPKPDAKQYIALVQATTAAMRQTHPQATIVAPASSEFPWIFLEELCAARGVLDQLDAVSVHPYRSYDRGPETAAADYRRLRGLIERHAPAEKRHLPILSGEWGYATHNKGISPETQAGFIARQQLANLLHGVPLSIWYDWKNDGTDTNYNEHNFGTVSHDLAPKPAYRAVQTLTRELSGCHIVRRLDANESGDFVLLLEDKAGAFKLAAWTTGKPHRVAMDLGLIAANVSAVDGQGQPIMLADDGKALVLDLSAAPQYLTPRTRSPKLGAAACWRLAEAMPTLVPAGSPAGLPLTVEIRNPLPDRVRTRLTLIWPQGSARAESDLAAGQSARQELRLRPMLRSPDDQTAKLTIELLDPAGTVVGSSSEDLHFTLSNPLKLNLAPVTAGLRLTLQNPARDSFVGRALVNDTVVPVRLEVGQNEQTALVRLPAADGPVSVSLLDQAGGVAVAQTTRKFQSLRLAGCRAALDGNNQVPAQASLLETNAPAGPESPAARVFRLDYAFDAGWRFVRCAPGGQSPAPFENRPRALGLWVYGDGSGNALRTRVIDSSGQTFQPGVPNLDWQGWRWVEFNLADLSTAGHWGGMNDGVPHGGLRLDTLLLVDGSSRKTSGTVYFAGPTLIY